MLGLDPLPARTPLNARITGEFQREGYRVQNIVFESSRACTSPAICTFRGQLRRTPNSRQSSSLVSGHSPGPGGAKVEYQHHGIWLARHGFVAFLLDTIEFGEIPGIHHGIHDLAMWHWLSLGYTPAGVGG